MVHSVERLCADDGERAEVLERARSLQRASAELARRREDNAALRRHVAEMEEVTDRVGGRRPTHAAQREKKY